MNSQEVLNQLQEILRAYFNQNNLVITNTSSAKDVEGWDSFSHMDLMFKIEKAFQIQIPFTVIMEFNQIGDIVNYLESKL